MMPKIMVNGKGESETCSSSARISCIACSSFAGRSLSEEHVKSATARKLAHVQRVDTRQAVQRVRVDLGGSWKLTGIGRHAVLQRVTHTFSAHRYFASFLPRRSSIPVSRILVITHIWLITASCRPRSLPFFFKSPTGRMRDNLTYTCYENTIPSRGKHGKHGKHVTPG